MEENENMRKKIYGITAGIVSMSLLLSVGVPALQNHTLSAATEYWNDASNNEWAKYKRDWSSISNDYQNVSLTPGEDETQLNLAWYSKTQEKPKVRISQTKSKISKGKVYSGVQTKITLDDLEGYYSNKVTITGLKECTTYYYQVYKNGAWQAVETYETKSFSKFSFLYVGDPQIGACKGQTSIEKEEMSESDANLAARNDAYNWDKILTEAVNAHPDVSFMVSAGDQVNTATSEEEYAGYLSAGPLSSLPVATTIGNHDSKSVQYSLHYNNPNTFDADQTEYTLGSTAAGSDYYYVYGDVLFIVLDTNNYNCATHENVIAKAVSQHKDAKWRVVMFHQDIYGSGLDHSDSDGMILRTQLTPIMDEYDIDVVLQGHDHTYSRTYQLTGDGGAHAAYNKENYETDESYLTQNDCYEIKSSTVGGTVVNPKGTVYLEANSATGSKFYNLISTQQDYIAERSQTWTPSYSVVDVTENTFSITTFDASSGKVLDGSSTYTIVKEADKTVLKKLLKTAKARIAKASSYTAGSIRSLKTAVNNATKVVNNKTATESQVTKQEKALEKAIKALVKQTTKKVSAKK